MPRKILAPHKGQEGFVYIRVLKLFGRWDILPWAMYSKVCWGDEFTTQDANYHDAHPDHRIISSRRVEEAVETADFLKLLTSEGLYASYWPDGKWVVSHPEDGTCASRGKTIREAYYRYKAEAELDAQQPGPFGDETEPPVNCRHCVYGGFTIDEEPCSTCYEANDDDNGNWTRPYFVRAAR